MNSDSRRTSVNEMKQIQRGLEEFLERELQQEGVKGKRIPEEQDAVIEQRDREPQLFTIEEKEMKEREIDVIGLKSRRILGEDYVEDWDSKERRRAQGKSTKNSNTRREDTRREGERREGAESRSAKGNTAKQESTKGRNKPEGGKRRKKSRFKRFLVVVVILLVLLGGGFYRLVGAMYDKMNYAQIDALVKEPLKEEGVVNILLIGNDSRENGADGRSDAMILLSISNKTKKIYMTSLLRDMYVDIPGHDGNRLNAAYSYGGAELLMETIEDNLDITVNRYVLVNFEAFANLVDAVGGIDLELTQEEIEYINGYLVEYNMLTGRPQGTDNMDASAGGMVHLNGPQALAYSRNRYLGTDFGRTERQRKVLTEVIHNLPKALITNPGKLTDGLLPNLTTNLTKDECFRLSFMAGKALTYDIVQDSIPQKGTYSDATIRGMSVLQVDFEANKRYLRENIFGENMAE